jgi:hypothetical protein
MSIAHIRSLTAAAFVLAVFAAQITDKTTGQRMPGLTVTADGPSHASGKTDRAGLIRFRGLKPGSYTIRISSSDVTPQSVHVTVKAGNSAVVPIKVCSMTLDYQCAAPGGGD